MTKAPARADLLGGPQWVADAAAVEDERRGFKRVVEARRDCSELDARALETEEREASQLRRHEAAGRQLEYRRQLGPVGRAPYVHLHAGGDGRER